MAEIACYNAEIRNELCCGVEIGDLVRCSHVQINTERYGGAPMSETQKVTMVGTITCQDRSHLGGLAVLAR
ncbi:MAG: hypothetical protein AAFY28_19860, partial [Actinomycetota bacterium]